MRPSAAIAAVLFLLAVPAVPRAEVIAGQIEYSVHLRDAGWTGWTRDGATAGTVGQSRPIEAVKIRLTGDARESYAVEYQCHMADVGWSGWSREEQACGT